MPASEARRHAKMHEELRANCSGSGTISRPSQPFAVVATRAETTKQDVIPAKAGIHLLWEH
jgi:hypothetical protein